MAFSKNQFPENQDIHSFNAFEGLSFVKRPLRMAFKNAIIHGRVNQLGKRGKSLIGESVMNHKGILIPFLCLFISNSFCRVTLILTDILTGSSALILSESRNKQAHIYVMCSGGSFNAKKAIWI